LVSSKGQLSSNSKICQIRSAEADSDSERSGRGQPDAKPRPRSVHAGRTIIASGSGGGRKHLYFIFHDETSGKETYPPGRFLDAELPKEGKVVLDFNKAYNPPCAFTPYATCPLPPKQNRLPVRIEAGEQFVGSPAHLVK
jgi:hypothetical protein